MKWNLYLWVIRFLFVSTRLLLFTIALGPIYAAVYFLCYLGRRTHSLLTDNRFLSMDSYGSTKLRIAVVVLCKTTWKSCASVFQLTVMYCFLRENHRASLLKCNFELWEYLTSYSPWQLGNFHPMYCAPWKDQIFRTDLKRTSQRVSQRAKCSSKVPAPTLARTRTNSIYTINTHTPLCVALVGASFRHMITSSRNKANSAFM